jgi:glutathionyl-hydroquinone reductase
MQADVNTGVYKVGFTNSQEAYESLFTKLFERLDELEALITATSGPFLLGEKLTDLDVRLYTTLIRFDPVY